jgi:hypothetical protein
MIAKCGYNRKTKREVIYGPESLAGAAFVELYTHQGIGQIILFLKFWRISNQTGRLLRVAVAWTQLAGGISHPILTDTSTNLPHLKVRWISSLRTFLNGIDAKIELDKDQVPLPQRQYNEHIMDKILCPDAFSDADINIINNYRLYLQAVTIADLTTACGTRLDPFLMQGRTSLLSSMTRWKRINQARSNEAAWVKWRSDMRI